MIRTVPVQPYDEHAVADLAAEVETRGFAAASGVLSEAELRRLRPMVDAAVAHDLACTPADRRSEARGRVLFLPKHDPAFLDLLVHPGVMGPTERVLGEDCTLFTMTTSCRGPGEDGLPLHRDNRVDAPGYVASVGALVLLDDLDEHVGPTRLHPERSPSPPDATQFAEECLHLVAPAGTVCWFDGRMWHDVPPNRSSRPRRVLIVAMVRPWMRPRFDIPRMLSDLDLTRLPEGVGARLGFDHLLPGSAEEYYLSAERRREVLLARARR